MVWSSCTLPGKLSPWRGGFQATLEHLQDRHFIESLATSPKYWGVILLICASIPTNILTDLHPIDLSHNSRRMLVAFCRGLLVSYNEV